MQDSLKMRRLGGISGISAFRWAESKELAIQEVNNHDSLLSMLNLGRVQKVLTSNESLCDFKVDNICRDYLVTEAYKRTQYVFFAK